MITLGQYLADVERLNMNGTTQQTTATEQVEQSVKKEVCMIRVMFVMSDESVAFKVRQAISSAIQDIPGANMDFRIANNLGAMMRA